MGFVQQLNAMFFVGMLNSIAMYPNERAIFYREDDDNSYPLEAFFIYYSALEIPMELLASLLFSLLTVLGVGLPHPGPLLSHHLHRLLCRLVRRECGNRLLDPPLPHWSGRLDHERYPGY